MKWNIFLHTTPLINITKETHIQFCIRYSWQGFTQMHIIHAWSQKSKDTYYLQFFIQMSVWQPWMNCWPLQAKVKAGRQERDKETKRVSRHMEEKQTKAASEDKQRIALLVKRVKELENQVGKGTVGA